jgi:DNA-binding MarR family transcriptional regulator
VNYPVDERNGQAASEAIAAWIQSAYRLQGKIEAALEPIGLSFAKLNVLTHLAEARQSLSLSEIAAKLNCVRSNVTQLVDRLEAEGLVRRLYDPTDRRTIRAELSELGRARQAQGAQAVAAVEREVASALGDGNLAAAGRIAKGI